MSWFSCILRLMLLQGFQNSVVATQIFFIFTPSWGNDPIWLIFFGWVETTNQKNSRNRLGNWSRFGPFRFAGRKGHGNSTNPHPAAKTVVEKTGAPGERLKGTPSPQFLDQKKRQIRQIRFKTMPYHPHTVDHITPQSPIKCFAPKHV